MLAHFERCRHFLVPYLSSLLFPRVSWQCCGCSLLFSAGCWSTNSMIALLVPARSGIERSAVSAMYRNRPGSRAARPAVGPANMTQAWLSVI